MSGANRKGPHQRFDTELRVYVTQAQMDDLKAEAERDRRTLADTVRLLLEDGLEARQPVAER